MIALHKILATFFGVGYVGKGGGTLAAIALCILWLLVPATFLTIGSQVTITVLVFVVGVWSGNAVDRVWGKDSSKVVIDEVGGMLITLLFMPITIKHVLVGLILFRFFDIAKPLFIRRLEALPKGWGVMADDLLAGIYAHLILRLIVGFNLL